MDERQDGLSIGELARRAELARTAAVVVVFADCFEPASAGPSSSGRSPLKVPLVTRP